MPQRSSKPGRFVAAAVAVSAALHLGVVATVTGARWAYVGFATVVALFALGLVVGWLGAREPGQAPRRRRGRSPARVVLAWVVSLGAHAIVLALLLGTDLLSSHGTLLGDDKTVAQDEQPLEIDPMLESEDDGTATGRERHVRALLDELQRPIEKTPEEAKKEEEEKKEEESKKTNGQVVDIARPAVEERPDKADYAAEYDSKVAHETKAQPGHGQAGDPRAQPMEHEVARNHQPALPSGNPNARPGAPGPVALREATPRPPGLRGEGGHAEELGEDGESRRPGTPAPSHAPTAPLSGQGGVPGRPGLPNLNPSQDILERAIGRGAGSMDYLKDVDDGESTALNAKKWKFASFFNRVKRAVADEWHPDVVYLRHDPSGNVYGAKDRVTILRVHLHPDGKIETLTVLQSSGVDFLDDEAMDAFRRAQPFVNPPPQLVEDDGLIHFNFGFIFELSGHTSFRFYKYQ